MGLGKKLAKQFDAFTGASAGLQRHDAHQERDVLPKHFCGVIAIELLSPMIPGLNNAARRVAQDSVFRGFDERGMGLLFESCRFVLELARQLTYVEGAVEP